MITQLHFHVHRAEGIKLDASWGYWFYAALMEHLPLEVAEQFHQSDRTPLSQYLRLPTRENCSLDWVVNIFGDDVEAAVVPRLETLTELQLRCCAQPFHLALDSRIHYEDANAFWNHVTGLPDAASYRLHLLTPTAFRSNERFVIFPDVHLILQSLLSRWNRMAPDLQVCDSDVLNLLEAQIWIRDYRLQTHRFDLKSQRIPGFSGMLWLQNRLPAPLMEIWKGLLYFSTFSGLGVKTALGMGAVAL